MSATRSRQEELTYKRYLANIDRSICPFCAVLRSDDQFVEATKSFNVIKNNFPYSIWDGQTVVDHLMVTPKQHTDNLGSMKQGEKAEYVDIIIKYEKRGYNTYSRAPSSVIKSIVHQHTHLIKTDGPTKRFIFLIRQPYIRIVR